MSREYVRAYMARRRSKHRAILIERLGGACVDCGATEGLQFDHKDPEAKTFTIGQRLGYALEALEAEADKCELRCAECHIAGAL